jgi:hypothetical protein
MKEAHNWIGASLAVEMWMDHKPGTLSRWWQDQLLTHGVGEIGKDGVVKLNALGWQYRDNLMKYRRAPR